MKAIRADLLDFSAAPAWGDIQSPAVRWRPDHWLLVGTDGRIAAVQAQAPGPGWQVIDQRPGTFSARPARHPACPSR